MFTTIKSLILCRTLRPSARNELEITDLNLLYLKQNHLHVKLLSRGMAWLDTGTTTTLLEAGNYIATIEHRQGLKITCLRKSRCEWASLTNPTSKRSSMDYRKMNTAMICVRFVMKGRRGAGNGRLASISYRDPCAAKLWARNHTATLGLVSC